MKDANQTALTLEPQAMTPMQMVQRAFEAALENNQGLEVIDRILAQQREMMEYNDRQAFQAALRRIQNDLKAIPKRGWNKETSSHYLLPEDIDKALDPLLKRESMSLYFEPRASSKPDEVLIVGILGLGAYTREYPLPMPCDGKGAKGGGVMSRTHATGSAITYGRRYLKSMIFDLHSADDDGNAAAGKKIASLEERAHLTHLDNIRNAGNKAELQRLYLMALKDAEAIGDAASIRQFIAAKDRRLGEL